MEDFKELDEKYIYYRVQRSDEDRMIGFRKFIEKKLKNRDRVPLRVFKRYVSFFKQNETEKARHYEKQTELLKTKLIEYFKPRKEYNFNRAKGAKKLDFWDDKMFGETEDITFIINAATEKLKPLYMISVSKHKFMLDAYDSVKNCISNYNFIELKGEKEKQISHYKICVIVGYTAFLLGYNLSNKLPELPAPEDIFGAVKGILKHKKAPNK